MRCEVIQSSEFKGGESLSSQGRPDLAQCPGEEHTYIYACVRYQQKSVCEWTSRNPLGVVRYGGE